jgi:ribonuclease HI
VPSFTCQQCKEEFQVAEATLAKFPGWRPKMCMKCKKRGQAAAPATSSEASRTSGGTGARGGGATSSARKRSGGFASSREENLTVAEVLAKYTAGPVDGIFTDGAAEPNPGPGGWGVVYVRDNRVVGERSGHEPHTTNNRMELRALIEGCALVEAGSPAIVYTDSQLCVSTIREWAKGWESRGWKRKGGEIKNLELVQELYALFQRRPELDLQWIPAHAGNRWNEYADALATAYRRKTR